jgi:dTDP-4-dehydrorhamnose reductase
MKKPRLLITGASGFLGTHLCRTAADRYTVLGVSNKNKISVNNVKVLSVDLCDRKALKELFVQVKPDAVIHAAAMSAPNLCQQYPSESNKINVSASLHIAELCCQQAVPMAFVSTDLVFDGCKGNYSESDPVSPVSLYGEQKVNAEAGISDLLPNAVICRMPLMFGDVIGSSQSFIQPMIYSFNTAVKQNLFTDEFRSPVSARSASQGILLALEKTTGIIHLGGKERISRYDFGVMLAEIGNFDKRLIVPKLQKEIKFTAPRPPDVSLNSSKAFSLGYSPDNIKNALSKLNCLLVK